MIKKRPYRKLEKEFGYRFKRNDLLETALTHPSHRHENHDIATDNQRLEFLGDAVLDLEVAEYLFSNRDMEEGEMTKLRSRVTCTGTLAEIARSIRLNEYLILGKGEENTRGAERDSNLADAFEALIGAAYLDGKAKAMRKIIEKHFVPLLSTNEPQQIDNPKGELQEIIQKRYRSNPVYNLIEEYGPAHSKVFVVEVCLDEKPLGRGKGPSKIKAEKNAALNALKSFQPRKSS